MRAVKTISIMIPEELDKQAALEARRLGVSKSAFIRSALTAALPTKSRSATGDLWVDLAGFCEVEVSGEPGEVDDVIYG